MADPTDLVPVNRAEFAAEMAPCLALVAPVGMDGEAQRAWLNAAFKALDGIPIALLKRGTAAAMVQADHPAKIVPAIRREIGESWDWRRKHRAETRPAAADVAPRHRPSRDEAREVGGLMRDLAQRLKANAEDVAA